MMGSNQGKIVIIAFGMEHCKRGVEAHARMLFEKLKEEQEDVCLIKGSGKCSSNEIVLSVPKRHTWLNRALGKLRGYNIYWEQVFFMIKLSFHLMRNHRDYATIYTQEYVHLIGMGTLKRKLGWKFDLVYCEGFVSHTRTRVDYADRLQEVNKSNYDYILPDATSHAKSVKLIPHFFEPQSLAGEIDEGLLAKIKDFRQETKLLIYVGPTDLPEKNFIRIEEAIRAMDGQWKLLICGDASAETMERLNRGALRAMHVYVNHAMMQRIYPMADLFVLPSLEEAFGIATIEAMQHGLPVLLHDSAHSRWLCNDSEQCASMQNLHAVTHYLEALGDVSAWKASKGGANRTYFDNTFTWSQVKDDYLELLKA